MSDDRRRAPGGRPASQRRPSGHSDRARAGGPTRRPATVRVTSARAGTLKVGDPRTRQRVVTLVTLVILLVFAVRLVMIQGVNASELSVAALENRLATSTIEPVRADIVDRNGDVMATSAQRYHVFVNQETLQEFQRIENRQVVAEGPLDAARILAPILGVSESELAADLVGDKTFQYIAKYVTPETWGLINAEGIPGIDREPVTERQYPNGNIGGNVVGFVGGREDKQGVDWGLAGVEAAFEDELLGTPGSLTYESDARGGTVIPTGVLEEEEAVPGSTVMLTLDRDIQFYAQQALDEALKVNGGSQGIVLVQDVKTGEFLAIADSGAVDPNDPGATDAAARGSRAVEDIFEPGSTAKVITMAAALEEGVATPTSRYIAPYQYTTENNQTFKDSHEHEDQKLTLSGVLVTSSNTGTIQVGEDLTEAQRHHYLEAFGFGSPTGVGLPTEVGGILHPWQQWDGRTKWAVLYGQGVATTALQTSQVYQTIANGGVRLQPSVVNGYETADGEFIARETDEPRQVVSEETADQLMLMLEDVTESGTGGLAKIDGYRVAGKTGTAEAADENGELNRLVSSFVGVAPADDPRIVVSVIVWDPKSSIWGGEVAAPVFKDVTTFALQALRVPPSGPREEMYPTTWE
ncbi:peptidoglycan D,D-transpeptidase FtsI family protein [Demequina muriae]|uniref:Penicillin-binding protein 2 n=1 Tax=Demequina muriae TaxID=3051664 RepID=A0ABT8GE15_9MICO|nr:penicillin-binding protein 2 [Demequina sp. EGI L300058]MDN4479524.1 penicillin-binding protein 2 [Demequina sp. EGI L300058]